MRGLTQRFADVARQIKSVIGDSIDSVDAGAQLVGQAGRAMQEIVDSIDKVALVMADIKSASAGQSAGIAQVNQALSQMDQVTQQNAALVEEAAASAEPLRDQAESLARSVGVFKLQVA